MVLLDLLHVQRAGFFKFLKLGIDKELSQLNINVENTRLQVIPFFADRSKIIDGENFSIKEAENLRELLQENLKKPQLKVIPGKPVRTSKKLNHKFSTWFFDCAEGIRLGNCLSEGKIKDLLEGEASQKVRPMLLNRAKWHTLLAQQIGQPLHISISSKSNIFKNLSDKVAPNKNSCFRLIAPKYTPREAILYQKSWSCKLVVKVLLTVHEKNKNQRFHKSLICRDTKAHLGERTKLWLNRRFNVTKNNLPFYKTTSNLRPSTLDPYEAASPKEKSTICEKEKSLICQKEKLGMKLPSAVLHSRRSCLSEGKVRQRNVEGNSTTAINHELFLVLGELPLMTKRGHFIIHGSPRVILSQLIRKPGIYFTQKNNELQADCIPEQGPWLCIYKDLSDESAGVVRSPEAKVEKKLSSCLTFSASCKESAMIHRIKPEVSKKETLLDPIKKISGEENRISAYLESEAQSLTDTKVEKVDKVDSVLQSTGIPLEKKILASDPSHATTSLGLAQLPSAQLESYSHVSEDNQQIKNSLPRSSVLNNSKAELKGKNVNDLTNNKFTEASYFCYTKQFSSMPFSLVYSTFRVFELHSQFTDQTLLLTKLKTLEKVHKFKDLITTLLTFTWKKRIRKRLQRLYTKRCFISTQQFEKTKLLFRLKKKLILGPSSRKSFNEKLGMTSCVETGLSQNIFDNDFFGNTRQFVPSSEAKSSLDFSASCKAARTKLGAMIPCFARSYEGKACPETSFATRLSSGYALTNHRFVKRENRRFKSKPRRGQLRQSLVTKPLERQGATSPKLNIINNVNKSSSKTKNVILSSLYSNNLKDTGGKNNLGYCQRPKMQNTPLPSEVKVEIKLNSSEGKALLSQDLALIVRSLDSYKILQTDDIDDLSNQRIRTPSDQIQQQVRIGLFRFKKMFSKLISSGGTSQTITDLLNGALREFFGSNPLSQFLDQTNPLAEITHKRRISKLGIGGIQRESATLKVRTIHSTYFGRICPIETPEGLNAGLVNSLTCLSRVDQKGQLVTPLSLLIEGQKQEQFFYYSNKENSALSTTDTALLKFHRLPKQFIYTKNESQFQQLRPALVKLRVKSDLQTISLATALIPFLAYDDANRALMGSNMQRQAVPLILPERPIIKTGMESLVTNESGHSFQSSFGGFVSYISAQYVVILSDTLNKRLLV